MALISFLRAAVFFLTRRLRLSSDIVGKVVLSDDGLSFRIFRHLMRIRNTAPETGCVFVVRFKFRKLSHAANIRASVLPIPLIAGFPGFLDKVWMIDWDHGYWQGVYQWESPRHLGAYQKSFVLGIMNRRAVPETLSYQIFEHTELDAYLNQRMAT